MAANGIWPDGKQFAFTVFDDTDCATLENTAPVYSFLAECGFRTTKSAWVIEGDRNRGKCIGDTCDNPEYLRWLRDLQSQGFEIGFHNGTWHGLPREQIRDALKKFAKLFGGNPRTAANHSGAADGIYWADARLTGVRRLLYNLFTRRRNLGKYRGHVEGDEYFWGDLCKESVKFFRNFTYNDINTLKACPFMPYHDRLKPYVNFWFAASDGHDLQSFIRCIAERHQDRLEQEGGACIMYTHFAKGFFADGELHPRFRELMVRLSKKNGWFVPAGQLLEYLLEKNGGHEISDAERRRLEWKWLRRKIFSGTT